MATVVHPSGNVDFDSQAVSTGDILEIREGTQVIDTDLDRSADQLNAFRTFPNFRGQLGTAASPAIVRVDNASAPRATIGCNASVVYLAAAATGGITTLDAKKGSGKLYLAGSGTIATLNVYSGEVEIGTGCIVTTLNVYGGTVIIYSNGTGITTLTNHAGQVVTQRSITTANCEGGLLQLGSAAACTTANVRGTSTLNHRSTGTLGTCNLSGSATLTPRFALTHPIITTLNINSTTARYFKTSGSITFAVGTTNNNTNTSEFSEETSPL